MMNAGDGLAAMALNAADVAAAAVQAVALGLMAAHAGASGIACDTRMGIAAEAAALDIPAAGSEAPEPARLLGLIEAIGPGQGVLLAEIAGAGRLVGVQHIGRPRFRHNADGQDREEQRRQQPAQPPAGGRSRIHRRTGLARRSAH